MAAVIGGEFVDGLRAPSSDEAIIKRFCRINDAVKLVRQLRRTGAKGNVHIDNRHSRRARRRKRGLGVFVAVVLGNLRVKVFTPTPPWVGDAVLIVKH